MRPGHEIALPTWTAAQPRSRGGRRLWREQPQLMTHEFARHTRRANQANLVPIILVGQKIVARVFRAAVKGNINGHPVLTAEQALQQAPLLDRITRCGNPGTSITKSDQVVCSRTSGTGLSSHI